MAFTHRLAALVLFIGVVGATLGCGKKPSTAGSGGSPPPDGGIAGGAAGGEAEGGGAGGGGPGGGTGSGNALFDQYCLKCHAIGNAYSKGKAPNLSKVGAKPDHTAEYLADVIKNPKTHNPN